MHGWADLETEVAELFAELQADSDYELFVAYNDIAGRRGEASAQRSRDWRAKQRLNPEWVTREKARSRARRAKPLVRIVFKLECVPNCIKRKRGPYTTKPKTVIVCEQQLSFGW